MPWPGGEKEAALFFTLSKIFWLLAAPSHVIVWISLAAAMALIARRRRTGAVLAVLAALLLVAIGVVPSAIWLLRPLDFAYGRPQHIPTDIAGILILGGGETNNARLIGAYALARRYPSAKVVYSGGANSLIGGNDDRMARHARSVLLDMGLPAERLVVESRSRNTWENILYSRDLVKPTPDQTWLLATSAMQLPRAMAIARKMNWNLVPWPTDWRTGQHVFSGYFLIPLNLGLFDEAVREWIGIFVYRLSGKAK